MNTRPSTAAETTLPYVLAGGALAAAWLGLWVDLSLFYEQSAAFPAFQYGRDFLRPFLVQPGGPSRYLAAFLAQACANRWLAAAVFAALALLLGWVQGRYVHHAAGWSPLPWGAATALAAVLVWTRYGFHLDSIVALTLAVAGAALHAHPWVGKAPAGVRTAAGVGLFLAGYWVCGGAVLAGVLLAAAVEHEARRAVSVSAALLLAGLVIPAVLGWFLLGLSPAASATVLLPFSGTQRLWGGLAHLVLFAAAVSPAVRLFVRGPRGKAAAESAPRAVRPRGPARRWGTLPPLARRAIAGVVAAALLIAAWPAHTARRLRVMKYYRSGDWGRVLAEAARVPEDRFTLDVSFAVNQALFHTGHLGEAMFAFPQAPFSLNLGTAFASCPNENYYRDRSKTVFDLGLANFEMGVINDAEHMAHEALAVHGPHPTVLKQLALANLIKRRPAAAAVFLRALCRDPVAARWAKARLETLERNPAELLDGEPIASMRAHMPRRQDIYTTMRPLEDCFLYLLAENPHNRMAFEFLMAQYLITQNLDGFLRELTRVEAFGVDPLPRHFQEAVVLCELKAGGEVAPWSARVSAPVRERFRQFRATVEPYAGGQDTGAAAAAAAPFRDTYFYYYAFNPGR